MLCRYLAKQLPGISSHRFPAGCCVQASTYEEVLNDAAYALSNMMAWCRTFDCSMLFFHSGSAAMATQDRGSGFGISTKRNRAGETAMLVTSICLCCGG